MDGLRTATLAILLIGFGGAAYAGVLPAAAHSLPVPVEGVTLLSGLAGLTFLRRRRA